MKGKKNSAIVKQDNRVTDERDTLYRLERNCLAQVIRGIQEKYPVRKLDDGNEVYTYDLRNVKNEKLFLSDERLLECLGTQSKNPKNNITYIKNTLKGLVHKACHIPLEYHSSKCEWLEVNWINYAKRNIDDKGFEIEISDQVIPYIINRTKNFTAFNVYSLFEIENKYAQRFYEKCCQFRSTGWFIMSEDEIRENFGVYKIDKFTGKKLKPLYENHSQFRAKVIEKAKTELEEKFKNGLIDCYFDVKSINIARGKYLPNKWYFAIGYANHRPDFSKCPAEVAERTGNQPIQASLFDDWGNSFDVLHPKDKYKDIRDADPNFSMISSVIKYHLGRDEKYIDKILDAMAKMDISQTKRLADKVNRICTNSKYSAKDWSGEFGVGKVLRKMFDQDVFHLKNN